MPQQDTSQELHVIFELDRHRDSGRRVVQSSSRSRTRDAHPGYCLPSPVFAAATACSVSNPNFYWNSLSGADAPNVFIPLIWPDVPIYIERGEGAGSFGLRFGPQAKAIRPAFLQEEALKRLCDSDGWKAWTAARFLP